MSSTEPSTGPSEVPVEVVPVDHEPVSPLTALRRHWIAGAVLILAGTLVGAAAGVLVPDSYTSESRIAVGSNDLAALSVPGYSFAAQELAASTARYVDNAQALGALEDVLGADADSVTEIAASPIPQSNIIRVEVTAGEADVATSATAAVTAYLLEQANRVNSSSDGEELLAQYADLSQQVAETSAELERLAGAAQGASAVLPQSATSAQAVDLSARLDVLQQQQAAVGAQYEDAVTADDLAYQLVTVADAAPSFDNATSQVQRYGLLGLVAGLLAALVAAVLLERRGGRPGSTHPDESELGGDLGLGSSFEERETQRHSDESSADRR